MLDISSEASDICLNFICNIKRKFRDLLYNHKQLQEKLGSITREKTPDNTQYSFDVFSHNLLLNQLNEKAINARLFSEEGGWLSIGTGKDYIIISDPFDQSTMTKHTFRNAAVTFCILDKEYNFKACAIGDLSTNIIYFGNETGVYILYLENNLSNDKNKFDVSNLHPSLSSNLNDAFIIFPGMKRKRRDYFSKSSITKKALQVLNADGVINLGRLAAGYIDAFLDPYIGQPVYEIVCAELAIRAGCVVTDNIGVPFDLRNLVCQLENDIAKRYRIVASCSHALHEEILEAIKNDQKKET